MQLEERDINGMEVPAIGGIVWKKYAVFVNADEKMAQDEFLKNHYAEQDKFYNS